MSGFVIVHVPHAGIEIPPKYRESIVLNDEELQAELVYLTDAFCDELYGLDQVKLIKVPISRLVCDVERFRDDKNEPFAAEGRGLMYTHTHDGRLLRNFDNELRNDILKEYYDPHHKMLTEAVDAALESYGKCLIIDGHSFYDEGFPDFCIGTDDFHTPPSLADALRKEVEASGFTCAFNTPYSGTITPMKHYGKDKRVTSVMIETNRRLYQLNDRIEKASGFKAICELCHRLVRCAVSE